MPNKSNSLTIAGSGIKFVSHLTTEVKAHIEQSELVLYLVNNPAMKLWIEENSKASESLDKIYSSHPDRRTNYNEIANYVIKKLDTTKTLCVVLYGHPTVFAQPGLIAAKLAKQKGHDVNVLPGISAEDCLFAELMINPASSGCQSFEATDFLIRKRVFDPIVISFCGKLASSVCLHTQRKTRIMKKGSKL